MRAVVRVAFMAVGAGSLYGLWAAFANRMHGADEMVRAGLAQGLSSALTTLIISSGIETVFRVVPHKKLRVVAAVRWHCDRRTRLTRRRTAGTSPPCSTSAVKIIR